MCVNLTEALESAAKSFTEKVERIRKYAETVNRLLDASVSVDTNRYRVENCAAIRVAKADLPKIRKVVGPLRVTYKCLSGDFETSENLVVYLRPSNKEFSHMEFSYYTKFRAGGKCRVEVKKTEYIDRSLVCSV